jgi:type I restriction enzyme S subunit
MLEGWKNLSVADLGTLHKGKGISRADLAPDGVPCLRYGEIYSTYGSIAEHLISRVSNDRANEGLELLPGDIVFAASGETAEEIGQALAYIGRTEARVGGDTIVLRDHGQDPVFLGYLFNSVSVVRQKSRLGKGQSVVHLHAPDIATIALCLPPLPEQRKIAEILRTWDEALEKLTALRAAHQDRFLGLRDTLMARASRRGEPVCFGDFLTESRIPGTDGATARKISVRLYGNGATEKNEPRRGSENTRYYRRAAGQIIWSKLDFLNGAFALLGPELDGCESTLDLPAFDCDPSVNPVWLIEYLTRPAYYTKQAHLARGQRKARRIAPDDWLASPLRLPDRAMQDRIADVLACARTELSLIDAQIEALTRQKRGLMQKLLTGAWRVKLEVPGA